MVYGFDREHIYVWRFCTSLTLFLPVNLTPACNEPWHAHVIAVLPRNPRRESYELFKVPKIEQGAIEGLIAQKSRCIKRI